MTSKPASTDTGEEQQSVLPLELPPALAVHDLATLMDVGPVEVIKELMRNGYMLTVNDVVEHDVAALVAPSFGYKVMPMGQGEAATGSLVPTHEEEDPSALQSRPPVVTILGHVDHGKTTLLGRYPQQQHSCERVGRDYPAYRGLSGRVQGQPDNVPGYPRPRGLHRHEGQGSAGDRYSRPRGCRR